MRTLEDNCAEFAVTCYPLGDPRQGIVHVMAPEQGLSRPGMTIVCGDSHTSTHGAFGALAFGIGTSEVEHVLATQTLPQVRPRTMSVIVDGELPVGTAAKDVILSVIGELGAGGGLGYVIEYRGSTITAMSMEQRMTVCNMSIEAGARAGMIAPDEVTFAYLAEHAGVPDDGAWETMLGAWRQLSTDDGARFDHELTLDATAIRPHVTWGTNPSQVTTVDGVVPDPDEFADSRQRDAAHRALAYMDLRPGTPIRDIPIDTVFIGSCTNGRLSDLREAAAVLGGRHIARNVRALVVPGSDAVKRQAELEGLDEVFRRAGFEWRHAGCSMCTAMNGDKLDPGQRCASTSNRNFEGRQGAGGRTHLVSPAVAAATAVAGTITTPFDLAGR